MKPGSLAVCINDLFSPVVIRIIPNRPKKGKIYTIRQLVTHEYNGKTGLLLEEIVNEPILLPNLEGMFEPSFDINRFVPLDSPIEIDEIVNEIWEEKVNLK
jgi:hypothetical protein